MKILIVDDSAYARQRLSKILKEAGNDIDEAESGSQALEMFKKGKYEAVTIDMIMPDMDGITLIKELRAIKPDVYYISVTADVQEETKREALKAGAYAFISKTNKPEEILNIISDLEKKPDFMFFSMAQKDAFTEMINIAMGQAANALSFLLDRKILLEVPLFEMIKSSELHRYFENNIKDVGAAIQQKFSGIIDGVATLIFPYDHAVSLVRMLLSADRELKKLSSAEQTVLAEVGNMVLNSAISILGNQFHRRLNIGIPEVKLNKSGRDIADSLIYHSTNARQAIILISHLTISEVRLISYLILMFPEDSIIRLLKELEV